MLINTLYFLLPIVLGIAFDMIFIVAVWREVFCLLRNPLPGFGGTDKRFKEIEKIKTRSILEDLQQ